MSKVGYKKITKMSNGAARLGYELMEVQELDGFSETVICVHKMGSFIQRITKEVYI